MCIKTIKVPIRIKRHGDMLQGSNLRIQSPSTGKLSGNVKRNGKQDVERTTLSNHTGCSSLLGTPYRTVALGVGVGVGGDTEADEII